MLIVMSSSVLGHQPFYNYFSKPPPKDLGLVRNKKNGVLRIISNNVNDRILTAKKRNFYFVFLQWHILLSGWKARHGSHSF